MGREGWGVGGDRSHSIDVQRLGLGTRWHRSHSIDVRGLESWFGGVDLIASMSREYIKEDEDYIVCRLKERHSLDSL